MGIVVAAAPRPSTARSTRWYCRPMRRAAGAAGWVLLAAGCEQPRTELVARVESEVAWGAGRTVQSVTLTVRRGGPTGPLRSARTTALGVGGERRPLPLLVGIVPADDTDTPVWIEALGCRAPNGCTVATAAVAQRAVVRFAVGQTEEVTVLLASACVGVTCGSDERCGVTGRCEPATRAVVRPFSGSDAGTMADGAMDVGTDWIDAASSDYLDAPEVPLSDGVADDTSGACPTGMLMIPGGMFDMGQAGIAEPVHRVHLSSYCMDITEVTVADYQACPSTTCTTPTVGEFYNWSVSGRENHPINGVDWLQSRAYCQWRGGDLPTEAQWEYAARGADGRAYPWGEESPDAQLCWGNPSGRRSTCAVRSFPSGYSPFGISDMAGNVWEWARDYFATYTGSTASSVENPTGPSVGVHRVFRGGSWSNTDPALLLSAYRYENSPALRASNVGFRCVRSVP